MQRNSLCLGIVALVAFCGLARADEGRTAFLHFGEVDRDVFGRANQCEFEFTLWDAPEGGERIGKALIFDGWEANKARIPLDKGQFDVVLDFGVEIFDDEPVYVESRCACGRSAKWTTVSRDAVTEDLLVEDDHLGLDVIVDRVERETPSRASGPAQLVGPDGPAEFGGAFNNTLEAADGDPSPAVTVDADGNTTMVGELTVGGVINVPGPRLDINIDGVRALRFEYSDPLSEAPNVIGGSPSNSVVPSKAGVVIAGGGSVTGANQVSEDWGVVSGGRSNSAFGMFGTVSGGSGNTATGEGSTVSGGQNGDALGLHSTVGGGIANTADGDRSTVSGGTTNTAGGAQSSIGGGQGNLAGGAYASVPGGFNNSAAGDYSLAGGRRAKALHPGSFVWADSTAADFASTTNKQFRVRATGGASFSHNVGIGTTTPGIPLTFANVLGNKISLWGQGGAQEHYGFGIQGSTLQMYAPASAKISFGSGRSDAFTERMQIAGNGNVGIGIAPAYPLHLSRTTSTADWGARFRNADSNVFLAHGGGYGLHINTGNADTTNRYGLEVRNASKTHFFVRDDGNVGVGIRSPAADFHVWRPDNDVARIYATGTGQGAGMVYVGQSAVYGGGIAYDGDGSPDIVGGTDRVTFFRRNNGADAEVMSYPYSNNNVSFTGSVSVAGNVSFGSASGFTHFGPVQALQRNVAGTNDVPIISSNNAFCSLSMMDVEDTDSVGERAHCNVFISGTTWYVRAHLPQNNDADVVCQARCLRWD